MTEKNNLKRQYVFVFALALLLYSVTCAPGLVWQDSGMIQYRTLHNDIKGGLGIALAHPLYYMITIIAKYFPLGVFPHQVNLVSALASAFAIANLFLLIRVWLGKLTPAVIAALSFSLAHTFWRHATIPESYNIYIAFFLTELLLLYSYVKTDKRKFLYWLFFVNGLSIAVHLLGLLPLACYGVLILSFIFRKKVKFIQLIFMIVLWIIAASPYLYLIVEQLIKTGDLGGTISSALFGNSWKDDVLNAKMSSKILLQNILFLGLNFPTPNLLLALIGLISIKKHTANREFKIILISLLFIFLLFAGRYTVVDRYAFFIPFYCMTAIFIAVGTHHFLLKYSYNKKLTAFIILFAMLSIPVYVFAPAIAKESKFSLGTRGDIKYRDDYKWFLQPWRIGYTGADKYAREALVSVRSDSVIIADGTTVYPILITQEIKNLRTDVTIVTGHGTVNNKDQISYDFLKQKANTGKLYSTAEKNFFTNDPNKPVLSQKQDVLWNLFTVEAIMNSKEN